MLMLSLSGLIAGAFLGLFARALALAVAMIVFSLAITALAVEAGAWSLGSALLGFVVAIITFQAGFLLAAGLRFVATTQRSAPFEKTRAKRHLI